MNGLFIYMVDLALIVVLESCIRIIEDERENVEKKY
jgi:hypothetical protein